MKTAFRPRFIAAFAALALAFMALWLSSSVQSGSDVTVEEVTFKGQSGAKMRTLLFRPDGATAQTKAPAILAFHGYLNNAEIQGNFATEFARRGYVVLAPDQRGHGASDGPTFADGFGGPDALAYLRSLPFVDTNNIGLEGHSMGGWTVLAAAKAYPDGYKSMVLAGSSVGAPFAPEGDATFPRNMLVNFGTYDEFGGFMWGPQAPQNVGATDKAKRLFGTGDALVQTGKLYGNMADGTARKLVTPPVTHPWLHQSTHGIAPAIDWFDATLDGAKPMDSSDQIWPWRETAALLALLLIVGAIGLCLPVAASFIRLPARATSEATPHNRAKAISLFLMAIIPVILFIPISMASEMMLGQNALFRQTFTNQFASWALVTGLLSTMALWQYRKDFAAVPMVKAFTVALVALVPVYALVWAANFWLHVNPSWWILTIRPLTPERVQDFFLYAPFFTFSIVMALLLLDRLYPLGRGGFLRSFGVAVFAMAGGFILFTVAQYATLAATGNLLLPTEGLRVITAINFAAFYVFVAYIAVASKRWTGHILPGAIAAGLFVSWSLTAVQPIGA